MIDVSLEQAARITTAVSMVAVGLDSVEALSRPSLFAGHSIFGEAVQIHVNGRYRRMQSQLIGSAQLIVVLTSVQLLCSLAAALNPAAAPWAIVTILSIRTFFAARHSSLGSEGSDHALGLILFSLLVYYWFPDPLLRHATMWFLTGEIMLAYVTAGWVKGVHPHWRKGTALRHVMATELFGNPVFLKLLTARSWTGPLACRTIIVLECTLPLLIFAGPQWCLIFLAFCAIFHLTVAVVQGLNLFLFVFPAAFPAILITAQDFAHFRQTLTW